MHGTGIVRAQARMCAGEQEQARAGQRAATKKPCHESRGDRKATSSERYTPKVLRRGIVQSAAQVRVK